MPEVFKYEIKTASSPSWMDITGLINSSETKITDALCTTAWKSATNTASFSIRYSDKTLFSSVLAAILEAADENERIDVRITSLNTGYIVFSGFLDVSSLKIASGKIPSSLSLSARDYIADLDKAASINLVLEDQSVRTIVARLLEEAVGYSGSLPSDIPDSIKIPYLVITSDDDDTYRTIIDTLLFESCGYVLYRNPATLGYEIRKIAPDEEPERIVHYVVSDTLSTKTGIFDSDGVRVEYPTVSQRVGQVLYSADLQPTLEDGELKGEEILPGQYYPSDGDISPVYQEYDSSLLDRAYQTGQSRKQSDDISLMYVKNARININPGEGFDFPVLDNIGMPSNPVFYPRKAWVLLRNNTDSALNLLTFTIEGLAVYKSRLNKLTMPAESENPEAYETRFIFSSETASAFGTFLLNFRRISSAVTTWTEKEPVSHLGEKVIVRHKGTEISQAYVVVQINDESFSGGVRCFRVTAVSVSGYSEYSWVEESSSGSIVGKQIATDGQQYYYSSSYETLQGGTWLDKQISAPGKALWTRRKITYTDGSVWIGDPVCSAAKPGADGKSSQYFYKYTKENNPDSWQEGASLFVHGNRLLGYRSTVFSSGMGEWQDHVPEGEQYRDDFLWTKIVHPDGTYDIIPPAKQGEPAYGLEIIAEPTGYQLTSRGVVKDDPAVINLSLKRHYVTYAAVWALSPENNSDITLTVDEEDHDKAVVSIRQGSELKSFTVAVDVGEHGVKASLMVSGISGGVAVTHYFGIYPKDEADARPSYHKDTKELDFGDAVFPDYLEGEGNLILGDYVLFMTDVITGEGESQTTTTELIPYYYTGAGSVWAMVDEYTPNYSEIMGSIIGDVTTRPDMPATVGALYGFFQNLAAQTAFINKLFSTKINLLKGGSIYAGSYDENGDTDDKFSPGLYIDWTGISKFTQTEINGKISTEDQEGVLLRTSLSRSERTVSQPEYTRWDIQQLIGDVPKGVIGTLDWEGHNDDGEELKVIKGVGTISSSYLDTRLDSFPENILNDDTGVLFNAYCSELASESFRFVADRDMTVYTLMRHYRGRGVSIVLRLYKNDTFVANLTSGDDELAFWLYKLDLKAGDEVYGTGGNSFSSSESPDARIWIYPAGNSIYVGTRETSSFNSYGMASTTFRIKETYAPGISKAYSQKCKLTARGIDDKEYTDYPTLAPVTWLTSIGGGGFPVVSGSMVTIDGDEYEVVGIDITDSVVTITTTSRERFEYPIAFSSAEGSEKGWIPVKGTLVVELESRGVMVSRILPVDSDSSIGLPGRRLPDIYGQTGDFQDLFIDAIHIGSSEVYADSSGYLRVR